MLLLSTAELKEGSAICAPEKLLQKKLDRSKCQVNSVRRIDQNMTNEGRGHSFPLTLHVHEEKLGE